MNVWILARLAGFERFTGAVDVADGASGEGRDHGPLDRLRDAADGLGVGFRGNWKPRLDDVHAQGLELPRHPQLLFDPHREARSLLPVAKRRVENDESLGHARSLGPSRREVKFMMLSFAVAELIGCRGWRGWTLQVP